MQRSHLEGDRPVANTAGRFRLFGRKNDIAGMKPIGYTPPNGEFPCLASSATERFPFMCTLAIILRLIVMSIGMATR